MDDAPPAIRQRDDDDLLSYAEAAAAAKVPERTFRGWVAAGTGPPVLALGRYRRIRWADYRAWLGTRYVTHPAAAADDRQQTGAA